MSYLYLDRAFNTENIKEYLLARMGRVLPLYLLIVLSSFLLPLFGVEGLYDIADTKALIAHLLLLYGESVLWTIPPEIHFYFMFLGFWAFARHRIGYVYVTIIGVLIILFFTNFPSIYGDIKGIKYNFFQLLRSLPYFFVGLIFGIHYKSFNVPKYLHKHGFVLVLLLIPLMYPEFSPISTDAKKRMWLSYEVLLVMSTVFFCVVFLVPNSNVLLANKVGDFIGKISYSLYLLHMPIIIKVNQFDVSVEVKLLLSILFSVAVAFVSFVYFERPTANFIRNIATHRSTKDRKMRASLFK